MMGAQFSHRSGDPASAGTYHRSMLGRKSPLDTPCIRVDAWAAFGRLQFIQQEDSMQ